LKGDFRYGLILRQSGDDQYYAFVVDPRLGSWHVPKRTPEGLEELATGEVKALRGLAPLGITPDKADKLHIARDTLDNSLSRAEQREI